MRKYVFLLILAVLLKVSFGSGFTEKKEIFTDIDGNKYKTIQIGTQVWMAENLRVTKDNLGNPIKTYCFKDNVNYCDKYGRLYTWEVAMRVAPKGWHLPSDEEWKVLVDFLGGKELAGNKLLIGGVTGFNALLAGGADFRGHFLYFGTYSIFWSSTEVSSERAYHQDVSKTGQSNHFAAMKGARVSIRLIKD